MSVYNGNMPKEEGDAVNRNPRVFDRLQLEWDGQIRGPALPRGRKWCKRTKEWWQMWRTSPQSMVMTDSDWEAMLEAALLHNMLWTVKVTVDRNGVATEVPLSPSEMSTISAELRRKVAAYGATYEDRAKLRMTVTSPYDEQESERQIQRDAKKIVDYGERLNKAAAEQK